MARLGRSCSVPGCTSPYWAKGQCRFHYMQAYNKIANPRRRRQPYVRKFVHSYNPHCHPIIIQLALRLKYGELEEVAAKAGVGTSTIFRWFRGHSPRLVDLVAVLTVLNIRLTLEDLSNGVQSAA